jgi:hypothetical protein
MVCLNLWFTNSTFFLSKYDTYDFILFFKSIFSLKYGNYGPFLSPKKILQMSYDSFFWGLWSGRKIATKNKMLKFTMK